MFVCHFLLHYRNNFPNHLLVFFLKKSINLIEILFFSREKTSHLQLCKPMLHLWGIMIQLWLKQKQSTVAGKPNRCSALRC